MKRTLLIIPFGAMLLAVGCGHPSTETDRDQALTAYLNAIKDQRGIKDPEVLCVLNEVGCVMCNRAFADAMRRHIGDQRILFVIGPSRGMVDLSGLVGPAPNIVLDDDQRFARLGLMEGSGIVLMKNAAIDTVILVNATELTDQLDLLERVIADHERLPS